MIDPTKAILDWEQADQIMQDQRAEIERLRLTDAEREAIEFKAAHCVTVADQMHQRCAVTLRALLERTKPDARLAALERLVALDQSLEERP
jgi:hypothetical protein